MPCPPTIPVDAPSFLVGLDEAGYGPVLGPLCAAAFACRAGQAPPGPVRDSKQVHDRRSLSPLVRRCAEVLGANPRAAFGLDDQAVLAARLPLEPWLREDLPAVLDAELGPPSPLPSWPRAAVAWYGVAEFNAGVERAGNKAEVLAGMLGQLIAHVLDGLDGDGPAAVACDRLGGRKSYAGLLQAWGFQVLAASEAPRESVYLAHRRGRDCRISFSVKADEADPCTAAASCFAKLGRELFMAGLNRRFQALVPGLRPTAGYPEDGGRFLRDIEDFRLRHNIDLGTLRRSR